MKKMYVVQDNLLPVTEQLYRTLRDCEKDVRIDAELPPNNLRFTVKDPSHEKKDGIIRVTGVIGSYKFALYINSVSCCFEVETDRLVDMRHIFYILIHLFDAYRMKRRLPPLDTHVISGIAIEDSPPVSAESYMEIDPNDKIKNLSSIMRFVKDMSFMDWAGHFCCCVCSETGSVYAPLKYVPVYNALIDSFKAAFHFTEAQLLVVRRATVQRLFFVTKDGRVYCCKTDGSRKFLNKHADLIYKIISNAFLKLRIPMSLRLKWGPLYPVIPGRKDE
jgi:hypothetical protein